MMLIRFLAVRTLSSVICLRSGTLGTLVDFTGRWMISLPLKFIANESAVFILAI